jgi:hypothetical protein
MVVKPVAYSAARLNEEKAVQLTCYVLEDFAPVSDFLETVRNLCDAFRGYYSVLIDRNGEIVKIYEPPSLCFVSALITFLTSGLTGSQGGWYSRRKRTWLAPTFTKPLSSL